MTSNPLTPKPPSAETVAKLNMLSVDVVAGKVYRGEKELGHLHNDEYICIGIHTRGHHHRTVKRANIVWWKATGEWPTQELDHDNRIKTDDRLENLRPRTHRENSSNNGKVNGLPTGVYHHTYNKRNPYIAQGMVGSEHKYLGSYATPEEASAAYQKAVNHQE